MSRLGEYYGERRSRDDKEDEHVSTDPERGRESEREKKEGKDEEQES